METLNRTGAADYLHPCSEIGRFPSSLQNVSSKLCVLLYAFLAVLAVVTVCGNLLTIVSVGYFRQLHTPTDALIVSLAASDLLVGVLVFPFSMAFSLSFICRVRDNFDIFLSTCSILNLCCIAVDRYYAVCQPLTYRTKMTNRVAVATILASWSISGLIGIGIAVAGLNHEPCEENCSMEVLLSSTLGPTFSFYLPALVMLCIYLKIFFVAQRLFLYEPSRPLRSSGSGLLCIPRTRTKHRESIQLLCTTNLEQTCRKLQNS